MRFLLAAVLLLGLFGCGYSFSGKEEGLPGRVQKIYLPLFINQTTEPQLESLLGNSISEVFGRQANIVQVENLQQAEAALEGEIVNYTSTPLSYDKNDKISEYRVLMTVNAKLRQLSDGRLLWQGRFSWDDEYRAADNKALQEDLERESVEEISLRIAENLLARLLADF